MFDEHYRRVNGVCTNNSRVALRVRVWTSATNSTERVLSSILFSNDRAFPSFLPLNVKKACAISPSAQFSLSRFSRLSLVEQKPTSTVFPYSPIDRLVRITFETIGLGNRPRPLERLVEKRRRTNANPFLLILAE